MTRLAIIPARAGSKRILNKNIKSFHGKPIIAWSIEAILKSKLFELQEEGARVKAELTSALVRRSLQHSQRFTVIVYPF